MLDTFYVKTPGVLTSIQDLGRAGYGQFGIAVSGAMDRFSFYAANVLVGNEPGAAGLEITLYRLKLEVLRTVRAAVTGADMHPVLDGKPLPMWQTVELPAGSTLLFSEIGEGTRCYLSVQGGIDAPLLFGSRSTHSKALLGKPLQKGDLLRALPHRREAPFLRLPVERIPKYPDSAEIRVVMGPQEEAFSSEGVDAFLSEFYTITPQSDRQGYRLEGKPIGHRAGADIISDAILPGSIQIPGNGQPIIMMVDAQTTGGYAKIACVIGPDIDILAQMRPGRRVRFCRVSIGEAHGILRAYSRALAEFESKLAAC